MVWQDNIWCQFEVSIECQMDCQNRMEIPSKSTKWFMDNQMGSNRSKAKNPGSKSNLNLTGFTLIELLVVIAIIALLLAILMPALQRVKRQAKTVACQANLGQWGIIWSMYSFVGRFHARWRRWSEHLGLRFCPMLLVGQMRF